MGNINTIRKIISAQARKNLIHRAYCYYQEASAYLRTKYRRLKKDKPRKLRPRILFYHISGLSFGGTEKFLQILAKNLDHCRYDVYFMYSPKPRPQLHGKGLLNGRLSYLKDTPVQLIRFDYEVLENTPPYFVGGMSPSIFDIIKTFQIDLLVTAGAGYSEFPFCMIRNIPIILLNIFGIPNTQGNISHHVCISEAVAERIRPVVPEKKIRVMYVPSEGPLPTSREEGRAMRKALGIPERDILFGRIGRPSDDIFDPIAIRAFQQVVQEMPWIHYAILSPPPVLKRIVSREKIPHVHFLPPTGQERDVWAFHNAIDILAHFRKDGESCGLNIAEAMLCGKPIITHRSHYWNAHLEYLGDDFALIADVDNVDQYAAHLRTMGADRGRRRIKEMGKKSQAKAEPLFLIQNNIGRFQQWVDEALGLNRS